MNVAHAPTQEFTYTWFLLDRKDQSGLQVFCILLVDVCIWYSQVFLCSHQHSSLLMPVAFFGWGEETKGTKVWPLRGANKQKRPRFTFSFLGVHGMHPQEVQQTQRKSDGHVEGSWGPASICSSKALLLCEQINPSCTQSASGSVTSGNNCCQASCSHSKLKQQQKRIMEFFPFFALSRIRQPIWIRGESQCPQSWHGNFHLGLVT